MTNVKGTLARQPGLDEPDPKKFKVLIGMPCYGGMMSMHTSEGLVDLCISLFGSGISFKRRLLGNESLITRARNILVAEFLQTDATHLLFLDADVGFRAQDVAAMFRGDWDVCVGAYPMKNYGWNLVHAAAKNGAKPEELPTLGALYAVNPTVKDANSRDISIVVKNGSKFLRVQDGATGFMLIKRECLDKYIEHYRKEIEYVADAKGYEGQIHHMVFQADRDPDTLARGEMARYLSEDFWFCRQWQRMGGDVYLCLDARLSHTGTHTWVGDVSRLVQLDKEPEPEPNASAPSATSASDEIEFVDPDKAA